MSFDITGFAVRRWQFTLVVFGLLVLLGLNALLTIPRSEDPHFPVPIIIVRAVLPGAEPTEVEQLVVDPIEDAVDGLDSLDKVTSTSGDGVAFIRVFFTWDVDPERKYDEVVREINAIRGQLPAGLTRLDIDRVRTTEVAIVQVALTSRSLPNRRLEKVADRLRERLDRVPGVRNARFYGTDGTEVRVALDMARLAAMRLPATDVANALKAAGLETPLGAIQAGDRRFNVKAGGAFRSLQAIKDTPVRSIGGQVVHVGDVAEVNWGRAEPGHLARFNGERAVFVAVTQKDGGDSTRITRAVEAELGAFERTLPAGVTLHRAFSQADNVRHRLNNLLRDFTIALALVMFTLTPLGLRAGAVVAVSIPLSLLIGLAMLQFMGFTLNQLSIAGFVLALGLLVDDSIVVTENIARRIREGEAPADAAVGGVRQIALAVLGCTATLMLAFLPLMALPGGPGAYIQSLPVTVLCTVGASLVVSLTIVPFLASRLLKPADHAGNKALDWVNNGIHKLYRPALHWSLARPWRSLALILALCFLTIPLLSAVGTSLFPPAETPQFLIRIETPEGTALTRTDRALRYVEARLRAEPKIVWQAANLGRGNPQIFYNLSQRESAPNYAEVFASLKHWEPGETQALLDRLRADFSHFPGARITVQAFENGPPIEAPVAVRLSGPDLGALKRLAAQSEAILKETPGTRDIDNPVRLDRTDLDLGVDAAKAEALGVPAGAIAQTTRLALLGEPSARFRDADGDDYPVTVRLPMHVAANADRNELADLEKVYVPTGDGQVAPLAAVASPRFRASPARIDRFDRERTVTVTAFVQTGFLTSRVTQDASERLKQQLGLPPGYRMSLGGQAEAQSDSLAGLGAAVFVAVFGILAVLVLEFQKFRTALVVAGIIPLGVLGAMTALWLTGYSLSFTATIGLIALIGIEIKNSILLVDFAEQLRREGVDLRQAIERAGEVRFLPVLLTSITAIGGLLPLAVEASGLYSPLAIAIIGGLISSTLLSRIATPVMYWLTAREARPASAKGPASAAET